MIAYKGFTERLTATCGKGVYQYEAGQTYETDYSKAAGTGFHCAEYPLDCFIWYPPGMGNRYFIVEAGGSIDETDCDSKIACTKMTLLKEINEREMAYRAMLYMYENPNRPWQTAWSGKQGFAKGKNNVFIARSRIPRVKGGAGSIIGLIEEPEPGIITAMRILVPGTKNIKADTFYTLTEGRLIESEEKTA